MTKNALIAGWSNLAPSQVGLGCAWTLGRALFEKLREGGGYCSELERGRRKANFSLGEGEGLRSIDGALLLKRYHANYMVSCCEMCVCVCVWVLFVADR